MEIMIMRFKVNQNPHAFIVIAHSTTTLEPFQISVQHKQYEKMYKRYKKRIKIVKDLKLYST